MESRITRTLLPIWVESPDMLDTLALTCLILSRVTWISFKVWVMESVILSEVFSRCPRAVKIRLEEFWVPMLRSLISFATTAKPFPASPALAASMDAFRASRLVCLLIPSMVLTSLFTISNCSLKSFKIPSSSLASSAMELVEETTSVSSSELFFACTMDSLVSCTIFSTSSATLAPCLLILRVISMEESALSLKTVLF